MVALQDEGVWVSEKRVECRDSGMEVDILEVFVGVDSCSAILVEVVKLSTKSGMARDWGSRTPMPPACRLHCVMRRA